MRQAVRSMLVGFLATAALAATAPDFSGKWVFVPAKSTNVGMMAGLEIHLVVEQNLDQLTVHERSAYRGQPGSRELHYDLHGQVTANQSPMGEKAQTVAHWQGGQLLSTSTSEGAVAGSTVTRHEVRSLSADGKTMTVESTRGTSTAVVMVYERE